MTTILATLTATNDPRFAEDIAHLQRLIAEADKINILTRPSTDYSIAHLSNGASMNGLTEWSKRHEVSAAALQELRRILMQPVTSALHAHDAALSVPAVTLSEAAVQNNLRLNASRAGIVTFRNNSGAGKMDNGSFVRFGLCNESSSQNAQMKSSDIIGIMPMAILPEHVGRIAGIFYARECKPSDWKRPSGDREIAQQRFIELINSLGGDAAFHNGSELI